MKRGETPRRSIRVDNELWNSAKAKADAENRNLTEVIVDALRRYTRATPRKLDK